MPTILITGATRGIGAALCQAYLADGWRVLATRRSATSSLPEGVEPYMLDITDSTSIANLATALKEVAIDVIWNNAGVYLDKGLSLDLVSDESWLETFAINTIAPIRIAHALKDNLANSTRKAIVFTSSKMGSLAHNGEGAFAYRSSKSALNMAVRCLANDYKHAEISCLLLHPGHVRTDMGGTSGAIDVETSVQGMKQIVDQVNTSSFEAFYGAYLDFDGSKIAW